MNSSDLQNLFQKYLDRTITDEEYALLSHAVQEEGEEGWQKALVPIIENTAPDELYKAEEWESIKEKILGTGAQQPVRVHRIHFLKRTWWKYAAAVLITFGLGTYLYISNQKEKPSVATTNPVPVQNDVAPGGNRATLTLADGREIVLDSAMNGALADQGSSSVIKKDNKLIYENRFPSLREGSGVGSKIEVSYNTMTTPRGGQYQLTLPDGSQVWLNAESSITYPTAFAGKERKVTITGEAYFEVAKDKTKPFIVAVAAAGPDRVADTRHFEPSAEREREKPAEKSLEIEVLGTHFNVNAYNNETSINTTLLEGSVKIKSPSVLTSLVLKPGQQGQLKNQKLSLAATPDLDQVMAWKNGRFHFESTDIETIMRQLSRAYDVDVKFEGKIDETFGGGISRNVNISQVLKMLELTGKVKFRVENRVVYVRP